MAFQRVPDAVEIIVKGVMVGQEIVNTFYATMAGYALADLETLAAALDTWVHETWAPLMPLNWAYQNVTVRGLNAAVDVEAVGDTNTGDVGNMGVCTANNIAIAIKRSSGFTGRAARGRIYVPIGISGIATGTNNVSVGLAGYLVDALDAMDDIISANGFLPVIVHRVSAGVPLATAVVYTLVEWVVVNNVLDSMRRRLPGRGV
jgi:hypothetical protein